MKMPVSSGAVLQRCRRADGAHSHEGSGLGLSIARWIVDLHGGERHPGRERGASRLPHGRRAPGSAAVTDVNLNFPRPAALLAAGLIAAVLVVGNPVGLGATISAVAVTAAVAGPLGTPLVAVLFLLLIAAGVLWQSAWVPRTLVWTTGIALLVFALLTPDALVAKHNVHRWSQTGRIDLTYLDGLSADAVPALTELRPRLRSCVLTDDADHLQRREPWHAFNLSRHRARQTLAALGDLGAPCQAHESQDGARRHSRQAYATPLYDPRSRPGGQAAFSRRLRPRDRARADSGLERYEEGPCMSFTPTAGDRDVCYKRVQGKLLKAS